MTQELINLISQKYGYRYDSIGTARSYKVIEVLDFEYGELGNIDILETIRIHNLLPIELVDPQIEEDYNNNYKVIRGYLEQYHSNSYAYWLCDTIENLVNNYVCYTLDELRSSDIVEITKYNLPEDYIVLSDLGDQGILIMSKVPQQRLRAGFSHLTKKQLRVLCRDS